MTLELVKSPTRAMQVEAEVEHAAMSLRGEIADLRRACDIAVRSLVALGDGAEPADIARLGGVIARLTDAIVRATLAEQKLSAVGDEAGELQIEIKRVFRTIGWGERS